MTAKLTGSGADAAADDDEDDDVPVAGSASEGEASEEEEEEEGEEAEAGGAEDSVSALENAWDCAHHAATSPRSHFHLLVLSSHPTPPTPHPPLSIPFQVSTPPASSSRKPAATPSCSSTCSAPWLTCPCSRSVPVQLLCAVLGVGRLTFC
jgi:hypothetical protein